MKSWVTLGLLGSLVMAGMVATASSSAAVVAIPAWAPFLAVALVLLGGAVLRRVLLEQPDS